MASLIIDNLDDDWDDGVETITTAKGRGNRPKSSRPNADLPDFFNELKNDDEIRAHCICKHDDTIISHFVFVPIAEYNAFLSNDSLNASEKEEWENKNLRAIPPDPKTYKDKGTIKKLTAQQMKKLCAALKRRTPKDRDDAYASLQAMREEELGFRTLIGASDRRTELLHLKSMVLFRFVTAIFSGTYRTRLGQLNHGKDHHDHETFNLYNNFFDDVSNTIKIDFASEHQGLHSGHPPEFKNLFEHYLDVDTLGGENPTGILSNAQKEFASPTNCKSHMKILVKVYQKMVTDMTVSGTHANNPFKYTGTAISYAIAEISVQCGCANAHFFGWSRKRNQSM
jgi:hypothetical protein